MRGTCPSRVGNVAWTPIDKWPGPQRIDLNPRLESDGTCQRHVDDDLALGWLLTAANFFQISAACMTDVARDVQEAKRGNENLAGMSITVRENNEGLKKTKAHRTAKPGSAIKCGSPSSPHNRPWAAYLANRASVLAWASG